MPSTADFAPFAARMQAEGLPDIVIRTFEHYYRQLAEGRTGLIPETDIEPVDDLPDADRLPRELAAVGAEALDSCIALKLNGGLGTSMGLAAAKSLLRVKDGATFLDIIARQAAASGVPLVLMNSYNTRDDSLAALARHAGLPGDLPRDFVQHKVPKVLRDGLAPAVHDRQPELGWCPPGHGDLYTALVTSGMLERLLQAGRRYAFVSNADNLGAVVDPVLLGYLVSEKLPFMMEVADRTEADRKGGHLARRRGGGLVLRELAQCPAEDESAFQDIRRYRYFNTNNLWLDLQALRERLDATGGILGLPMIRNGKTLDPRDRKSPPVWQLETAMGAAIEVFPGSGAVRVPPARFAPIKKTNDLLDVRSDNYVLTEDQRVVANPARTLPRAVVDLDPAFFQFVDDFEARFPAGPPSLLGCRSLVVRGDVTFGGGVVLEGDVVVANEGAGPLEVPAGSVISGAWPCD